MVLPKLDCKADCGQCSGQYSDAGLNCHKVVQCDQCEMWVHNVSSLNHCILQVLPRFVQNVFFNFSDSIFTEQLNLEGQNRFNPLANDGETRTLQLGQAKTKFIRGLKVSSISINCIRSEELELLADLDFYQPQIFAIQEIKFNSSITTSELFQETCPCSVYRKDRNSQGGCVMCCLSTGIPRICPSQNWETTQNQVGLKCSQTKLLILW